MPIDSTRIEHIFNEAVARPVAERPAFLDESCAGDAELRARVELLLKAHESAGEFLAIPSTPIGEAIGSTIGRYKLLEQIGEGGFGVVFMAEQTSPVRRLVALKIIKLGMDTKQVIARFEAERQALAMMDHPNVARVFDAGATETGRPYFVMELVKGVPITEYCDQHKLNLRQRLELFAQVCQAIQHAHQKGIIHRDLKPTNVLVASQDGRAVAKVIDFGIAKATQSRLTEQTLFTEFRQWIGTPQYMSPEQADGVLDVDTRSDVYALGVLLYELLTGTTPFDAKELRTKAYEEMRRVIREVEPPRPSTRLSHLETLPSVAATRQTEPRKLQTLLRGELDWIVMRCLEKDRGRRYETANALCHDVERYLADEPVRARPPTAGYRLWKFARRNKLAVMAVGAVASALIIGSTLATIGLIRARREAARADRSAATANAVSRSLQQMLRTANPHADRGPNYTVRQMLDDFSETMGKSLADEPEAEADVAAAIGMVYYDLNVRQKAEQYLGRAVELRRKLFGANDLRYAKSLTEYAWAFAKDDPVKGEAIAREAYEIGKRSGASDLELINSLRLLELALNRQQKHAEVEATFNEAMAIARRQPDVEYEDIANMNHEMVYVKLAAGDPAAAERCARTALEMHLRRDPSALTTGWGYFLLGMSLDAQNRLDETLAAQRSALGVWQKACAPTHRNVLWAYGGVFDTLRKLRAASKLAKVFPQPDSLQQVVALFRAGAVAPPGVPSVASQLGGLPSIYSSLAAEYRQTGRSDLAALAEDRRTALLTDLGGPDFSAPELRSAVDLEMIRALVESGDHAGAMKRCRSVLEARPKAMGPLNNLAWSLATDPNPALRDADVAVLLAERVVELDPKQGNLLNTLGVARFRQGDYVRAIADLQRSCELGSDTGWNHFFMAMSHHHLGQAAEARRLYGKGASWMDKNAPQDGELRRFRDEAAELLQIPQTQPAR